VEAEANEGPRVWTEDDLARIGMARALFAEAQDPRETLAEKYWLEVRMLDPFTADIAGHVLRFHPRRPWRDENTGKTIKVPALVACFRSIDDNSITGVHRTRLNPDGTKCGRRMLGIVHRCAIMFGTAGDELVIAEGIETSAAGMAYGFTPAWALGSAGAISFLPIIERVQRLVILTENDATNARATSICTKRWRKVGKHVRQVLPAYGCSDLNDALIRERA
jgi:putative DNA primase/helicase